MLTVSIKVSVKPELVVSTWLDSFLAKTTAARKSSLSATTPCVAGIMHTDVRKSRMNPIILSFFSTASVFHT